MRSVPPVSLYLLEPVLQAEYQRFMPDFTTKIQKKTKNGQRSACTSMFFGTGFAGRVPAHISFRISFYLVFGTKNKNKKTASHGCAEIPAGIPAGIPQLTGRWQKQKVLCPAVPAPMARWRFGPQVL